MKMHEVFDKLPSDGEVNVSWEPSLNPNESAKTYKGRFTIDGDEYIVGFNRVETVGASDFYVTWDLNRNNFSWWQVIKTLFTGRGGYYDRTGLGATKGIGYTLKVLKGVFSVIQQFVATIRPAILTYHEHDEKLRAFYDQIAKKIAPKFGYRPHKYHSGFLVRSDKVNSPAIMKVIQKHLDGLA